MTKLQEIERDIREIKVMAVIAKDDKERCYYRGQIDGILGILNLLGIETKVLR